MYAELQSVIGSPAPLEIPETAPLLGTPQNSYTAKDLGLTVKPLESALTRNSRFFHISFKMGIFKALIIHADGCLYRKSFEISNYRAHMSGCKACVAPTGLEHAAGSELWEAAGEKSTTGPSLRSG